MHAKSVDLGRDPVKTLLLRLSIPSIASNVVNMLYNLVDRMYIGHMQPVETVGKLSLTALGVCAPIILIISAFSALFAEGGAPKAAIMEGRGDREGAERIMGNSFVLLLLISFILTTGFLLFSRPLLMAFGASENTIGYALDYIRIYLIGTVFVQITAGMTAYITSQGYTAVSLRVNLVGTVLNVILDPILIYLLDMGVRGAAIATVLSQAVACGLVLKFLTGSATKWRLRRACFSLSPSVFMPTIALGLSPFTMRSTESLLSLCFNSSLLKYGGDLAVGTLSIMSSIVQFSLMPLHGFTQGGQPIISYNFGAGKIHRVQEAFSTLLKICILYPTLLWILVQLCPSAFIRIFSSDPSLVEFASGALRVFMASAFIYGVQSCCQSTFVALGNAPASLFLAIYRKFILLIPLIFILPHFFADKTFAVYLAQPISDFIAAFTTAAVFFYQFRKLSAKFQEPSTRA